MNRNNNLSKILSYPAVFYRPLFIAVAVSSSVLLGCAPQAESMFEQQAEAEAANEIGANIKIEKREASESVPVADSVASQQALSIDISKQQTIARQPECDPQQATCQYLELNTLRFTPAQPWLSAIMWQTISRVLSPDTPFASQQQVAKDTVASVLKQIEFSSEGVSSQPSYQRINTDLTVNEHGAAISAGDNAKATSDNANAASNNKVTGYLLVEATEHRGANHQQWQLNYIMLDMQKKLQLTLEDILLPNADIDKLLMAFQAPKKQWLSEQGIEQQYLEAWPLPLAKQWYIDQQGLHLVYQSGELLNNKPNTVDLVVAFSQLQGIVKPDYMVASSLSQ